LFVSSFSTINKSILPIRAVAAEVENNEDEYPAYVKFVSQAVKQSDNSSTVSATIHVKTYSKGCKINHFGYGILQNTSKKMPELMEIAALTTSLVYLLKTEWKKQCLIMKNYCTIPFWLMTV
jgi:hypothetical protein